MFKEKIFELTTAKNCDYFANSQKLLKSFMCVNNSRDTVTLNTIHVPNIENLERSGISQLKLNVALLSVSERRQFLPQPV